MKNNALYIQEAKRYLLPMLLLSLGYSAVAQTDKSRTIEKTFDGKTAIWASHRYGALWLKKGTGNQVKAVLTITASGKNPEEVQELVNHFNLDAAEAPDNKVDLKTAGEVESWKSINGRTTITFKDGKSFSGIQKFKMTLEVYVPKLRYATLENKYDAVKAEDGTADILEIKLYDGEVDAPGSFEKLLLDMKYSEGKVGNFNQCEAELYDCDLQFGNGQTLKMESKYSGYKIGDLQALTLDAYDDEFKIGSVSNTLEIKDKYSEFTFLGNIGNATLDLYDSQIKAQNGGAIQVTESKYTEFVFQELVSLHFGASYDDNVRAAKVGSLSATTSKYTEFEIGGLWKELKFPDSYDDTIDVRNVGGTFAGLTLESKYTDLKFPIPASVPYEIDASLKYGTIHYPESDMETSYFKEKNDEVSLRAKVKGAGAGAPVVKVKSYDGEIMLK